MAIAFVAAEGHTHGSNTDFTITKPTGTASGDVMITVVTAVSDNSGAPAFTMSDWTELDTETTIAGEDGRCSIYYRVAGASEPSSWTGSRSPGGAGTACAVVTATYSGVDNSSPVIAFAMAGGQNPTTQSSGNANNTDAAAWAVGVAGGIDDSDMSLARSSGTPTTNRGGVQTLDNTECASTGLWDSDGVITTGNKSFVASENLAICDWIAAGIVILRPASVGTQASAEHVAVTATANQPATLIKPNAEHVAVTATANQPTALVKPNAEHVSVSATAYNASVTVKPNAEHVAVSVTANDTVFDYAPAEQVTTSVTAFNASVTVKPNAEHVAVSAVANSPVAAVRPNAGHASVSATANDTVFDYAPAEQVTTSVSAYNASVTVKPNAEHVAVSATANSPVATVKPNAEHVAVSGVANAATVDAAAEGNAPAGHASVTVSAQSPQVTISPLAGLASVSVVANAATAASQPNAGHASVSAVASQPAIVIKPNAGHASVSATAYNASVMVKPNAGHASVSATAGDVTAPFSGTGLAEQVTTSVAAFNATVAVGAQAGHASAVAVLERPETHRTGVTVRGFVVKRIRRRR